ncbi:MAG TPA: MotA/TolQ/ExbB proton channel family protein [Polyangiaceae bacterium]|nr:MotA/TolQ/ExbB proton channel family protein [Polyangiaceae bacterium]
MEQHATAGLSLIKVFLRLAQLGAEWVMWLMLGLAFICVVIIFERLFLFLSTSVDVTALARKLSKLLEAGKYEEAQGLVKTGKAMEERVLADALSMYRKGADSVEEIAAASMIRERQRYERALSYLGTVGANGPFIGLLGTVIGVILSFSELGRNPKGGLEVVGPGISEALVATAVGLLVAIPAVVFFNWFKGLLKKRVGNADFLVRIVSAHLKGTDRQSMVAMAAED